MQPSNRFTHPDRQLANAFSCSSENRICDSRRCAWYARLADAAGFFIILHDVYFNFRCFIDSQHRVIVEITLLNAALLKSELVIESRSKPEDNGTLNLRFNDSWIHISSAVDGTHNSVNPRFAAGIDRDFGDLRGVAFKRCVYCDPTRSPCRQRLSPSSFFGRQFEHSQIARGFCQQLPAKLKGIFAAEHCQFINEAFFHEGGVRMSHRPPPQHRHANLGGVVLYAEVRDRIRNIVKSFHGSSIDPILDYHALERSARHNRLAYEVMRPDQRVSIRRHSA